MSFKEQVLEVYPHACVVKLTPKSRLECGGYRYILWISEKLGNRGTINPALAFGNSIDECWKNGWEEIKK